VEVIIHALRKIKPAAGMTLNIGEVLIDSINHPSFMLGGALCKARGQVTFEDVIHQANAQYNIQLQLQLKHTNDKRAVEALHALKTQQKSVGSVHALEQNYASHPLQKNDSEPTVTNYGNLHDETARGPCPMCMQPFHMLSHTPATCVAGGNIQKGHRIPSAFFHLRQLASQNAYNRRNGNPPLTIDGWNAFVQTSDGKKFTQRDGTVVPRLPIDKEDLVKIWRNHSEELLKFDNAKAVSEPAPKFFKPSVNVASDLCADPLPATKPSVNCVADYSSSDSDSGEEFCMFIHQQHDAAMNQPLSELHTSEQQRIALTMFSNIEEFHSEIVTLGIDSDKVGLQNLIRYVSKFAEPQSSIGCVYNEGSTLIDDTTPRVQDFFLEQKSYQDGIIRDWKGIELSCATICQEWEMEAFLVGAVQQTNSYTSVVTKNTLMEIVPPLYDLCTDWLQAQRGVVLQVLSIGDSSDDVNLTLSDSVSWHRFRCADTTPFTELCLVNVHSWKSDGLNVEVHVTLNRSADQLCAEITMVPTQQIADLDEPWNLLTLGGSRMRDRYENPNHEVETMHVVRMQARPKSKAPIPSQARTARKTQVIHDPELSQEEIVESKRAQDMKNSELKKAAERDRIEDQEFQRDYDRELKLYKAAQVEKCDKCKNKRRNCNCNDRRPLHVPKKRSRTPTEYDHAVVPSQKQASTCADPKATQAPTAVPCQAQAALRTNEVEMWRANLLTPADTIVEADPASVATRTPAVSFHARIWRIVGKVIESLLMASRLTSECIWTDWGTLDDILGMLPYSLEHMAAAEENMPSEALDYLTQWRRQRASHVVLVCATDTVEVAKMTQPDAGTQASSLHTLPLETRLGDNLTTAAPIADTEFTVVGLSQLMLKDSGFMKELSSVNPVQTSAGHTTSEDLPKVDAQIELRGCVNTVTVNGRKLPRPFKVKQDPELPIRHTPIRPTMLEGKIVTESDLYVTNEAARIIDIFANSNCSVPVSAIMKHAAARRALASILANVMTDETAALVTELKLKTKEHLARQSLDVEDTAVMTVHHPQGQPSARTLQLIQAAKDAGPLPRQLRQCLTFVLHEGRGGIFALFRSKTS